jgi:hypothetical protein
MFLRGNSIGFVLIHWIAGGNMASGLLKDFNCLMFSVNCLLGVISDEPSNMCGSETRRVKKQKNKKTKKLKNTFKDLLRIRMKKKAINIIGRNSIADILVASASPKDMPSNPEQINDLL